MNQLEAGNNLCNNIVKKTNNSGCVGSPNLRGKLPSPPKSKRSFQVPSLAFFALKKSNPKGDVKRVENIKRIV